MKKEVFIFGDSIVFGLNDPNGGWVTILKAHFQKLEFKKKTKFIRIYNLGISGNTSKDIVKRFENEFLDRWNKNKVPVIIIAVGVNDLAVDIHTGKFKVSIEEFEDNISFLIQTALKLGVEKNNIILFNITNIDENVTKIPDNRGFVRSKDSLQDYNKKILEISNTRNIKLFSVNSCFNSNLELDEDGLHPNQSGHSKIFEDFLNTNLL
jgi:lysophospholipase L1-like esterase